MLGIPPQPHDLTRYAPPGRVDKVGAILQRGTRATRGQSVQKLIRATLVALVANLLPMPVSAPSCNTADRSVLLILDASGSMNAKLPNGETRIAVAQRAIKGVAGFVPGQVQLSLRMYGAQSAAAQKNCQDTHLAVPFGAASAAGADVTASVDAAKAQGYTPIAHSLGQAAKDFSAASMTYIS